MATAGRKLSNGLWQTQMRCSSITRRKMSPPEARTHERVVPVCPRSDRPKECSVAGLTGCSHGASTSDSKGPVLMWPCLVPAYSDRQCRYNCLQTIYCLPRHVFRIQAVDVQFGNACRIASAGQHERRVLYLGVGTSLIFNYLRFLVY
jgi:hypothetical protein